MTAPRIVHDHYPTIEDMAQACVKALPRDFQPRSVIDIGAGSGGWGRAARLRWPSAVITGVELRDVPRPPWYDLWMRGDALRVPDFVGEYDLVLGNPPFGQALPLMQRALLLVRPYTGIVAFLLRLSWLEPTRERGPFHQEQQPWQMIVTERGRFRGDTKNTDSVTTALFLYRPKYRKYPERPIDVLRWKGGAR